MADYIVSEEVLRQVLDILEARLTKENRWTAGECDTMDNLRAILASPPAEPVGRYRGKEGEYGYDIINLLEDIPEGTDLFVMPSHRCQDGKCFHASDCAVHNEPAYPAGKCNCGKEMTNGN